MVDTTDFFVYSSYLIGPLIATVIAFIDILDDYSIFRIKIGLKYKIMFSFMSGLVCLILLMYLWDSALLKGITNPVHKGIYVGVVYSALLKSKIVIYDKKDTQYWSPEELYNKLIGIFRDLIDDSTRNYITDTKNTISEKYPLNELYCIAKDSIEDDPRLSKAEHIMERSEYLKGIEVIKNDDEASEIERAKSLAKFIIDKFPSSTNKLLDSSTCKQRK